MAEDEQAADEPRAARFEAELVVLRPNPVITAAAVLATVLGVSLLLAYAVVAFAPGLFGLHLLLGGAFLGVAQATHNLGARRGVATVSVTAEGITTGCGHVARETIADGLYQPRTRRPATTRFGAAHSTVRFRDRLRRVVFEAELPDEPQALDLLRTLGLDAASKRAEFLGASPVFATVGRNIALFVAATMAAVFVQLALRAVHPGSHGAGSVFLGLFIPMFLVGAVPSKIVVGIDGILVRWLWTRRFIPMSEIETVLPGNARSILVRLRSGVEETIHTSNEKRHPLFTDQPHRDAVYARIVEALNAHRAAAGPAADITALLRRGSRTPVEWQAALDRLENGDRGYRAAALRDEDLWRVVEDPRAAEDARAGAAVLLRRRLDDDGKARVRVLAEATASPRLRVALDAAASGSNEEIDAALSELTPAADRRSVSGA